MANLSEDHNLQKANPELAKQWHPTKNGKLKPRDVTPQSSKYIWWKCTRGHQWRARVAGRARGTGCPYCMGRKLVDTGKWKKRKPTTDGKRPRHDTTMRKVGETSAGSVLVEMSPQQWQTLSVVTAPPEHLGEAIVQYRKRRGITQGAFAELVGHSRNWISAIERDRNIQLSYETYKRIIAVING